MTYHTKNIVQIHAKIEQYSPLIDLNFINQLFIMAKKLSLLHGKD